MKKLGLIILILIGAIVLFSKYQNTLSSGEVEITDISKDSTIVLVNREWGTTPYGLGLHITGKVDDSIGINHLTIPKGEINFEYHPDTYTDTTQIKYRANNAKEGYLKIKYKFGTIYNIP